MRIIVILLLAFSIQKGYSQRLDRTAEPMESSLDMDVVIRLVDASIKSHMLQASYDPPIKVHKKIKTILTDTLTSLEVVDAQIKFMEESEARSPGVYDKLLIKEKARRTSLIADGKSSQVQYYCFVHECELTNAQNKKILEKIFVSTDALYNIKASGARQTGTGTFNLLRSTYRQTRGYNIVFSD